MADGDARSDDTGASGNEEDTERQSRRPCTHAGSIKVSVVKPLLLRFAKRCNGRLTGWMCTICGQWEAQRVCPHFGGKHCFVLELDTGNCWCYKCDRLVQDAGDVSSTKLFDRVSELSELWSAAKTIAEDAENAAALSQAISDSPPLRDEPSASGALSKSAKKKKDKRASDSGSAGGGPPPREAPDAVSTGPDRASAHLLPVRGLYNLGNTCFFNSVMQNLCVMHCLRDELARRQASAAASVGGQSLPQLQSAVLRFLQDMNSASAGKDARKASYDPGNVLAMAGRLNPAFRGRQQQDAHELLRTLLDGMRDEELEIERLHRRAAVVGIIRSWPPEEFERWRSSCCSLSLAREDLVQLIVTPASKASKALMKRFSEADRKSVSAALQTLLRGGADRDCDPAERSSDESDAPSGSDAGDSDADADADGKVDEDDEKSGGRSNVLVEPSALPSESKSDGDEGHLFSAAVAEPSADRAQLSISSLVQHADPSLAGTQQGHVEQGSGPCKQESAKTRKRRRREVSQAPVKKDTAVDRVFGGLLQSTVVCLRCGQASVRFEPFFDLSLPIAPPPSLATLGNSARKKKKTQAQKGNFGPANVTISKHMSKAQRRKLAKQRKAAAREAADDAAALGGDTPAEEIADAAEEKSVAQSSAQDVEGQNLSAVRVVFVAEARDSGVVDVCFNVFTSQEAERDGAAAVATVRPEEGASAALSSPGEPLVDVRIEVNPLRVELAVFAPGAATPIAVLSGASEDVASPPSAHMANGARAEPRVRVPLRSNAAARLSGDCRLQDCLEAFTDVEELRGENRYYCERCKTKEDACRWVRVREAPQILTLHLKRFAGNLQKINKAVSFSTELDIGPFTVEDAGAGARYALLGVSVHSGGYGGGHYVAYVRKDRRVRGESGSPAWFYFSDTHFSHTTESNVLQQQAYLLFFERVDAGKDDESGE